MAATDQLHFFGGGAKSSLGYFLFNFNIPFLAACGCTRDFLKMLAKFKMAAKSQHKNILMGQKLKKLTSKIIQFLQSHSPQYGDVHVSFSRFCEIQNGRHAWTS